jgi:hypothetical protein
MRGEKAQLSIEDGKNRGEKKIDAAVINKSHYCTTRARQRFALAVFAGET